MNLFDTIFKKMFTDRDNMKYINGVAYGTMDNDKLFKAQFKTRDTYEKYEAIEVSILNKREGVIDRMLLTFDNLLSQNRLGQTAHIWKNNGKLAWYGNAPTQKELDSIGAMIEDYVSLFQEQTESQEYGMQQM